MAVKPPRGLSPTRPGDDAASTPASVSSPTAATGTCEDYFNPVKITSSHMSKLRGRYDVGRAAGKGGYAVVYKGTRRCDGLTVAIKKVEIFEMSVKKRERCLQEVQLLGNLRHRAIIRMLDSFLDENVLIIVFEWAAGGDLKRLLKRHLHEGRLIEEAAVWSHFHQIVDAVAYMHGVRVMHRDVKPANVLVTSHGLKVADLGLGRHFSQETQEVNSKVGTPYYVSPEVVKGAPYDWSSDVWSLGCLLYELATLRSPFEMENANLYAVFRRISKAAYAPLPSARFSRPLLSLVRRMLCVEPEGRPSIGEVLQVCKAAVGEFDKIDLGPTRGVFAAAEGLADRLAVLQVESSRFKPKYRPGPDVFRGVHTTAFFTPAPAMATCHWTADASSARLGQSGAAAAVAAGVAGGDSGGESDRDRFGRVVRVGSWLLLLLGRKGLSLEAEAEALALLSTGKQATAVAAATAQGQEQGAGVVAGVGGTSGSEVPADHLIDKAGCVRTPRVEAGVDKTDASGGGGKRGTGRSLPLPCALESEALAQATEEETRRYEIAAHFLEEAGKYGVATEFMCPHAVAKGYGWVVVSALGTLCEAAFNHLKIRTRASQHPEAGVAEEYTEDYMEDSAVDDGGMGIRGEGCAVGGAAGGVGRGEVCGQGGSGSGGEGRISCRGRGAPDGWVSANHDDANGGGSGSSGGGSGGGGGGCDMESDDDGEEQAMYGGGGGCGGGPGAPGTGAAAAGVDRTAAALSADRAVIDAAVDPVTWRAETERLVWRSILTEP